MSGLFSNLDLSNLTSSFKMSSLEDDEEGIHHLIAWGIHDGMGFPDQRGQGIQEDEQGQGEVRRRTDQGSPDWFRDLMNEEER